MLKVDRMSCGYPGRFTLQDISFSLESGQIMGIIGPNGSGKTTLLRAVSNTLRRTAGGIFLNGIDIARMGAVALARQVAVVSAQRSTPFEMPVQEYIALGRFPFRRQWQFFENRNDRTLVEQAMELTGTLPLRRRLLHELSSGERQLVVIARALAQQPKLLLLDEPVVYLDITHQVQILDLVRRLNRSQGLSVLLVLHELNLAAEYCDRLLLMQEGRLHSCGTPQDVLQYRIIEAVYRTPVVVRENPFSRKPYVLTISEAFRKKRSG